LISEEGEKVRSEEVGVRSEEWERLIRATGCMQKESGQENSSRPEV
jgi:hypothetical protein